MEQSSLILDSNLWEILCTIVFTEKYNIFKRNLTKKSFQDGSRSFGLFRKGEIGIIAKFHRTDLVL